MTISDLEHLPRAKRATIFGRPGIRACCPAHEDTNPSFYAWEGEDGWIHVRCSKCGEPEIMAALGWNNDDRRYLNGQSTPNPQEIAAYPYHNERGEVIFQKRRYYKDRKKQFAIERREGNKFVSGLLPEQKDQHLLYNLPGILKAIRESRKIYICEGEKACDALIAKGHAATCQPFGADCSQGTKWRESHTRRLAGADAVIIADRDEVGVTYARSVYFSIKDHVKSVALVQSKTQNEKDDAYDHLAAGHGVHEFIALSPYPEGNGVVHVIGEQGKAIGTLELEGFGSDFTPEEVKWLVPGFLPLGKSILFDADGGTGKTSFWAAYAAWLSSGYCPLTDSHFDPVRTLYLHQNEDTSREIQTIYHACGGKYPEQQGERLYFEYFCKDLAFDDRGIELVGNTIADRGMKLVVVDAFFYFLLGLVKDTNDAMCAMKVMRRWNKMLDETGCTGISLRHTVKGTLDRAASNLGLGTVQYRNSHRGQYVARFHPQQGLDPSKRGIVYVEAHKDSLLYQLHPFFAYRRVDREVHLLPRESNPFAGPLGDPSASKNDQCKAWLTQLLTGQFVDVKYIAEQGKSMGFSDATIRRARNDLSVQSFKTGADGGWVAHIDSPEGEDYNPYADQ